MSRAAGEIREGLMEAMGRITSFWGFSKIMGQLYGLLYLFTQTPALRDG
jgi:DNA-binding transcriptional regulator GbsR (MarR family)